MSNQSLYRSLSSSGMKASRWRLDAGPVKTDPH